ncbi:MAG TPA: peptidoglycan DD-metalloendopeptidase family protein [Dongiaceae bacterium]|nr:peptidoglycan DD-metalloendopeptidase family protein [Dongiaceae bacterium]
MAELNDAQAQTVTPGYPRKHLLAAAICSAAMVVALTLLPSPDATATKTIRLDSPVVSAAPTALDAARDLVIETEGKAALQEEPATESTPEADAALATAEPQDLWQTETVRSGDTLSHVFQRAGLNRQDVQNILDAKGDISAFKKIHPGQRLRFDIRESGLAAVEYVISRTESLLVEKKEDGFHASLSAQELVPYTSYAEGTIDSSLFVAARKAGLSTSMTMDVANLFAWDVDFALDIQKGDSFKVIYRQFYLNGEKVKDGEILAAQFTNEGKTYTSIRYETEDGSAEYYTPKGESMHKAFLRSPVDFARISSHFNLSRKHPVLHTIRAHKGTDYAASRGTPIKATGDGKVIFAGWKGGYGRVVIIQHAQGIQTLYGHMNGFARNVRAGSRVNQGQLIGYVGNTGLATGPHVHYEFHVNGSVRNPVTVKLPMANPIAASEKAKFTALAAQMQSQLATYAATIRSEQVARTDINE